MSRYASAVRLDVVEGGRTVLEAGRERGGRGVAGKQSESGAVPNQTGGRPQREDGPLLSAEQRTSLGRPSELLQLGCVAGSCWEMWECFVMQPGPVQRGPGRARRGW